MKEIRAHRNEDGTYKPDGYTIVVVVYDELERRNKMDCNECKYLMVTEKQQEELKLDGFGFAPHICMKYDKRVFHRAQSRFHSGYLYPCEECEKENDNETN